MQQIPREISIYNDQLILRYRSSKLTKFCASICLKIYSMFDVSAHLVLKKFYVLNIFPINYILQTLNAAILYIIFTDA